MQPRSNERRQMTAGHISSIKMNLKFAIINHPSIIF